MPKPPRGTTLICSPGSPVRSARMSCQALPVVPGPGGAAALNRARCRATRGLSGSSGSCAVTMCRPGARRWASGRPWPRPRTNTAPAAIGQHQVEAAPAAGVQCGNGRSAVTGGAVRQRQQRQFAPASLAGGWSQAARPVQHRRHHAGTVHAHPGAAARAIAPGDHIRSIGPMGGGRIPGPVQHFIAIGGQDERPGVAGADQQDDGAHWIDYDSGRAKDNGQAFEHLRHQLAPRRRCLGTPSTYLEVMGSKRPVLGGDQRLRPRQSLWSGRGVKPR